MQLANGEHIVGNIKKHWIVLLVSVFFSFFIIGIPSLIRYFVEEIKLTNRQFYVRTGIISRQVTTIPLRKINAVNYEQGIIGRIFGYGTLLVQAGSDFTFSGYHYIANPEKTKTMIEHAIEAAEER